jgi:hypothetical protein
MNNNPRHLAISSAIANAILLVCIMLPIGLAAAGCNSQSHTSNPRLRKIDELLETQLPKGTPRQRVSFFLSSRGYTEEHSKDSSAVVGVVHHVDTETLQPSTARVTFHFDAQDKLTTYDMQEAPENTIQP